MNLYSPDGIMANPVCCLRDNFVVNALAQGGPPGLKKTKKVCCTEFSKQTGGVDVLNYCRNSS